MKYSSANSPYESLLEEAFANSLKKYLKNEIALQEQHEVETICGNFRFDFIIEHASQIIAFECDGQNFHDENAAIYDFWRDSVLLAENHTQIIFRLSGPVLMQKMHDCILLLSHFLPNIFDSQAINKLLKQTGPRVKEQITQNLSDITPNQNSLIKIIYPAENEVNNRSTAETPFISLKSQTLKDERHKRLYNFVKKNNGGRLNPLIYKYHKKYNNYGL